MCFGPGVTECRVAVPGGLHVCGVGGQCSLVLPCALPQAGQTPLEAARYHNNPEVALLLTKAPQVGLAAFSAVWILWGYKVPGSLWLQCPEASPN